MLYSNLPTSQSPKITTDKELTTTSKIELHQDLDFYIADTKIKEKERKEYQKKEQIKNELERKKKY